jgi:predicted heme/steroid binding protein
VKGGQTHPTSANSSRPAHEHGAGGPGSARVFTPKELAAHDGTVPGRPILIAYKGCVYDVTGLFMWMTGMHFWLKAGHDLTGRLSEAPHGEEMLLRARYLGRLVASE